MRGDIIKTIKVIDKGEEGCSENLVFGQWYRGVHRSGCVPWDRGTTVPLSEHLLE